MLESNSSRRTKPYSRISISPVTYVCVHWQCTDWALFIGDFATSNLIWKLLNIQQSIDFIIFIQYLSFETSSFVGCLFHIDVCKCVCGCVCREECTNHCQSSFKRTHTQGQIHIRIELVLKQNFQKWVFINWANTIYHLWLLAHVYTSYMRIRYTNTHTHANERTCSVAFDSVYYT